MTALLPIVEQLYDCQTDAERAAWLLGVPQGIILRDLSAILIALRRAGFLAGIACLEAEFAALNATRLADGRLPEAHELAVNEARRFLADVAQNGGAV
ncbi:hypothetical protein [Rhizobium oryziradicis]|uniref:Uncharacterized protein n=1 Tax=Rhizobium oryziradicis TaxID=1867956 RepID=A0A1Q8ZQD0_9HYPH|nr:hypothetical protein [Rhizobium oryziradicis]OLP44142.1 hypothetical protein BJF95_06140 [Rhizobium oryziradicis]